MTQHQFWLAFLGLFINCTLALDEFPAGACSAENLACEIHEANLVAFVSEVASVEECRQLCSDEKDCSYFSHFGPASFPIANVCVLLSSCQNLHQCEDCIAEEKWCFEACGDNVEGLLAENIVQILADVPEELECKRSCNNNTDCKFYTYHNESDPNYPQLCFLLTYLEEPLKTCSHCSTGSVSCAVDTVCGFRNGTMVSEAEALIFTDTSSTIELETVTVGKCEVNILAIGGGGQGSWKNSGGLNFGGGGGSGHVFLTSYVLRKSSNLLLNVGGRGKPSSVTTKDGSSVIQAPAGEDGVDGSRDGADGFSGGGGDGQSSVGSGGSDGRDGEAGSGGQGGKGSGLDISSYDLINFVLTPGSGGRPRCGGGGGGVMVNGEGPEQNIGSGEGYGGGGEGCNYSSRYGSPGAILIEIKK